MEGEGERIPNLLERLDLNKFHLKELKHFDDYEHKNLYSNRSLGKTLEIAYTLTFNFDILVTHLEVELNSRENFTQLFEIGEIQGSCLTNRGIYSPVIRSGSRSASQSKNITVPAIAITQTLKISLLLKKEFALLCGDVSFKKERSKTANEENVSKMITHAVRAINVCGYYLNMNTSASELVPLLNISQSFKQSKRLDEAAEVDILVSLSLISARRFVQASQLLKKVSKFYVDKYVSSKSSMELSRIDRTWMKEDQREWSQISGASRSFAAGRVLDGGKYLYKAAKIELLLAETINQPSLLSQKLQAYHRANSYANGNINPPRIQTRSDYEETIYSIGTTIIPFLVKMLSDKSEILKISSLKSIEFFYQNLGCTLSNLMPLILKNLIAIYPLQKDREEPQMKTQENQGQRNQLSNRTKLILDHINHLLQSLLGLLVGMNKKYLKVIFEEIIIGSISEEYRNELRLYLLRFGQKILQMCGADLEIPMPYIKHIFTISQGRFNFKEVTNKHINHNLTYFSQRILQVLKFRILKNYQKGDSLRGICNWIHQTLIYICQNQTIPGSTQLTHILDIIISIFNNTKFALVSPVQPIIYLLNTSLHQAKLPFDKILEAFIVLIGYGDRSEHTSGLGGEIIERIMTRSKISTLSLKELKILEKVLEVEKNVNVKWLEEFLDCIPHSNFDEIYSVFDLFVAKCVRYFDKRIVSLVINTLFNQYTVKGKAHQHSKEHLITSLIQEPTLSFTIFLQICLFENHEAKAQAYYSKNSVKGEHCFDTKLFKLHSQLFIEKINLLLLVLNKKDQIIEKFISIFTQQVLIKIHRCWKEMLLKSTSLKLKSKILVLIKQLILIVTGLKQQEKADEKILLLKVVMQSLKPFITFYKESKLHYYTILNIGLAIEMIQNIPAKPAQGSICNFEFMAQDAGEHFKVPPNTSHHALQLTIHEMMDIWPNLIALFLSPWENVREVLMLVILNSFRQGLRTLNAKLKQKACDHIKQLLYNLLQSNDFSERLMGIKLYAAVLGLAHPSTTRQELVIYIESNWRFLRQFLQIVVSLQADWNEQITTYSKMICRLCLSTEVREVFAKRLSLQKKYIHSFIDQSVYSLNFQQEANFAQKKNRSFTYADNFEHILRADDELKMEEDFEMPQLSEETFQEITKLSRAIFKLGYFNVQSIGEKDSFAEEDEQHYFDPNDEKHSQKEKEMSSRSEEEQLQFQDLGIIQLDDEEWGQQESEVRITQRLPLKKVYKLSPNLASNKHHRISNKRYHHTDIEEDKIIVDELEGRINYPQLPHPSRQEHPRDPLPPHKPDSHPYLQHEQLKKQEEEQVIPPSESRPSAKREKKGVKKRKSSVK